MYFIINEEDFEKLYNYFTGDINDIFIMDSGKNVIYSNKKESIGFKLDIFNDYIEGSYKNNIINENYKDKSRTLLINKLPYCNISLVGSIDSDKAFSYTYNTDEIVKICIIITLVILVMIFIIVEKITRPLYVLTKKMTNVKNGKFNEYIKLNGSNEIKELSDIFNIMINDLNKYISELLHYNKNHN